LIRSTYVAHHTALGRSHRSAFTHNCKRILFCTSFGLRFLAVALRSRLPRLDSLVFVYNTRIFLLGSSGSGFTLPHSRSTTSPLPVAQFSLLVLVYTARSHSPHCLVAGFRLPLPLSGFTSFLPRLHIALTSRLPTRSSLRYTHTHTHSFSTSASYTVATHGSSLSYVVLSRSTLVHGCTYIHHTS